MRSKLRLRRVCWRRRKRRRKKKRRRREGKKYPTLRIIRAIRNES